MFNVPNTIQSEQQKTVQIPSPPSAPQQPKPMAPIPKEPHSTLLAPSQQAKKEQEKLNLPMVIHQRQHQQNQETRNW